MITKGKSTTGRALAAHLLKPENDRVEVLDIRGAAINDLREAIGDWREFSKGTACEKPIYHAQLNPDRDLSREEWDKAIGIFEKEMGLEGYPRAVVLHEKEGREHIHLVYSRFNPDLEAEHLRAWSDSWNYPKHERASREIERELGLQKTQGVFLDREGDRPDRTPSHDAMQQGDRTKLDPRTVKAEVSEIYRSADSGRAFVAGLEEAGYTLARGDQRGYVILDQAGGIHSLSRMAGVKVGELRDRLQDYPVQSLPTVEAAREMQQERQQAELVKNAEQEPQSDPLANRPRPEGERLQRMAGRYDPLNAEHEEARELAQTHAQRPSPEQGLVAAPSSHFAYTLGDSAQVTRMNSDNAEPSLTAGAVGKEIEGGEALPNAEQAKEIAESRAEVKDLEREGKDTGLTDGREADAPTLGVGDDPAAKGMNLGGGAINAVVDGVAGILGGLFEGLAGGKPPTSEQQKEANEREARAVAREERIKQYNKEHKQRQEQDRGRSNDLSRK